MMDLYILAEDGTFENDLEMQPGLNPGKKA